MTLTRLRPGHAREEQTEPIEIVKAALADVGVDLRLQQYGARPDDIRLLPGDYVVDDAILATYGKAMSLMILRRHGPDESVLCIHHADVIGRHWCNGVTVAQRLINPHVMCTNKE